jgi:HAD superfamily hydrolase (TIGR01509 family)
MRTRAVTFDIGQVLLAFDAAFLAKKLAARRIEVDVSAIVAAEPAAWEAYGRSLREGRGHGASGWKTFVRDVAAGGGAVLDEETLAFLYADQRERNLWRRPVAGMHEVVRELVRGDVPLGVVSNSEGALATLLRQTALFDAFACIADSGALGIEKPSPAIFRWVAERLGVDPRETVHVGDSWSADVEGALAAGARVVWFPALDARTLPPGVVAARDADEVRRAIAALLAAG